MRACNSLLVTAALCTFPSVLAAPSFTVTVNPENHGLDVSSSNPASVGFVFSTMCSAFSLDVGSGTSAEYDTCGNADLFDVPVVTSSDDDSIMEVFHKPLSDDRSLPSVTQKFTDHGTHFTLEVILASSAPFKSNYIGVAKVSSLIITTNSEEKPDPKAILVPFDNDIISMYQSRSLSSATDNLLPMTSSYVAPLYDEVTRAGVVIGSLEHTTWKTGFRMHAKTFGLEDSQYGVRNLEAVAGLNGLEETRDWVEHGWVESLDTDESHILRSPRFFVGEFDDWRDGMEMYARSQVLKNPDLPDAVDKPIVGWNSWGVTQFPTTLENAVAASGVMKGLEDVGFEGSFIDFDAVTIPFSEQAKIVETTNSNAQRAGFYSAPWSYFSDDLDATVECGGSTYKQFDLVKKGPNGKPLKAVDKLFQVPPGTNYAYDPTHPGVLCLAMDLMQEALDAGMKLVKIDFINWGAMEGGSRADGSHYESSVKTGFAAYNYGMERIADFIDNRMVISLSMAPTFPNHFAHARRVGCDQMYGGVEFTMNQLWGGWWQKEMLMLDPDLMVFNKDYIIDVKPDFLKPYINEFKMDAMSRVNKGVVHGGLYLAGDDMTNTTSVEMVEKWLGNERVNAVARLASPFRAIDSPVDGKLLVAPNAFETRIQDTGEVYIAIFNYKSKDISFELDLARTEAKGAVGYEDVWTGGVGAVDEGGVMTFQVGAASSMLLKMT